MVVTAFRPTASEVLLGWTCRACLHLRSEVVHPHPSPPCPSGHAPSGVPRERAPQTSRRRAEAKPGRPAGSGWTGTRHGDHVEKGRWG